MKKIASLFVVLTILFCIVLSLPFNTYAKAADTASKDGIEISIVTDKEEYGAKDDINIQVIVANTNRDIVEPVTVEMFLPKALEVRSGDLLAKDVQVGGEESYTASVVAGIPVVEEPVEKENGFIKWLKDNMIILIAAVVAAATVVFVIVLIVAGKKKKAAKLMSFFLCLMMILPIIPIDAIAKDKLNTLSISKAIKVDGKQQEIEAEVKFKSIEVIELTTHSIMFALNDGSNGFYEAQVIEEGEYIEHPLDPERTNYNFSGWFADEECTESFDFSNAVTEDATVYAGWTWALGDGEEGYQYATSTGGGTTYSISATEVIGNVVRATINVNSACTLLVRFLDEETNAVITSVTTTTPGYCEMTPITIPIERELPRRYIIKASLVDSAGEEMCDRFTDLQNTTAYKNFEKQTIHDFEDRYVVNFDDSEDNNFGVLNENVVVVEPGRGENIFTYINNLDDSGEESDNVEEYYEFENPGDEISDLEPGDYVYIEDTTHLIKVENVLELDSNTVRLTPDKDMELYEAYDVVKVDTVVYAESAELQGAGVSLAASDEDVSVGGEFNAELGGSFEKELTEWLKLEGSLTGSFSAEIKIAYDIRWFAKDEFTFSLITGTNIKASITLSVFTNNDDLLEDAQEEKALTEIKLGKLKIPTNIPGLTITTTPFIPLEAELSAGITVEYTNKSRSGFIFSNINGKQKIDKKEETTKFYGEGKFTVKAGPKVEVGVEFLEEVLEAKLTIFGGLQVEATLVLRSDYLEETTTDDMHACNACLDCDVSWFFEANASLTYNLKPGKKNKKDDKNKLSGKLINIDIVKASGHFPISPKCYISLLNDAASVFEGEITFGWGECPNKKYRTEFVVKDEDGNEIPNVETVITNYAGENYGGGNTKFAEYLYKGEYIALCSVEGVSYHEIFEVEDSAQTVTILTVTKGTLEGKICDAEDRVTVLPGALIEIYKDGELYTTKTADSNGAYSVELHVGEYTIKISHDGYIDFKCHATVEPDRTTYMETFLMIEGEEGDEGAASGKVMNSLTGEGEDGVTLEFLPDWNNKSETAEAVASTTSDSDGDYEIELPIGNYTVRASKEEFTTSYFNIIVIPDETTDNQNGVITPVLGEGEGDNYLITLSWGANPRDLDSHLVGPLTNGGTFHVFYSDKSKYDGDIEVCNLDYDDTSSYGPEHITLVTLTDGAYYFYVHKYAGTGEIPTSEARVTIERGNTLVAVYNVPTSLAAARYWNVFAIKDGQIIVSNTITESPDTSYAG